MFLFWHHVTTWVVSGKGLHVKLPQLKSEVELKRKKHHTLGGVKHMRKESELLRTSVKY